MDMERDTSVVRVYLVAENRLLRQTLLRLFQKRAGISIAGESPWSEVTTEKICETQCNVLLLHSLEMPHPTNLIAELKENTPQIRVILFGMDEVPDIFLSAVRSGVRGYLLEDSSSAAIIAAVRSVMDGEAICPPSLCSSLFQLVSQEFRQRSGISDQQACVKFGLTYRQRQLVTLIAKGMTNKEIAGNLHLSEFTVKNHISRIMKQVDADSRYEAVDMIRAHGLLRDM